MNKIIKYIFFNTFENVLIRYLCIIQQLILKIPNLLVILSLISFLSISLVTGSPFKSYTNLFEDNNHILLKITPIYAQDNGGDFEGGNIFPGFEEEDNGGEKDGDIFPDFKTEDDGGGKGKDGGKAKDGGEEKDGGSDGGKAKDVGSDGGKAKDGGEEKDGGNEERINENTNDFSPLSSGSPINTDDKINPYGSPINTDDKVHPYDEVGQPVGQQSEQVAEDSVQVDQQSGEQVDQQTVGTEVNQTEQQTVGTEVNQTEQQQNTGEQVDQQTVDNEVNQTEQQQNTGEQVDQQSSQQP